jgi:quinol monooxygenase YgiN
VPYDAAMNSRVIALHLRIRVKPENREHLLKFLREARPFYEQPGGITMRVFQNLNDPHSFIEVFEYESQAAYEADDERVRNEVEMKTWLSRWRALLDGPPVIEVYSEERGQ